MTEELEKCEECEEIKACHFLIDPYVETVHGEEIWRWLCEECYQHLCEQI